MKESEGQQYLTTEEVAEQYKWAKGTLYYFRTLGLLNSYKFLRDKRVYWRISDLEMIKNRPPEETKRGPKPDDLAVAKTDRSPGCTVMVGAGTLTAAI